MGQIGVFIRAIRVSEAEKYKADLNKMWLAFHIETQDDLFKVMGSLGKSSTKVESVSTETLITDDEAIIEANWKRMESKYRTLK